MKLRPPRTALHPREDEGDDFVDEIGGVSAVLERPAKGVCELRFLVKIEAVLLAVPGRLFDDAGELLQALRGILRGFRAGFERQHFPDVIRDFVAELRGRASVEPFGQHSFPASWERWSARVVA